MDRPSDTKVGTQSARSVAVIVAVASVALFLLAALPMAIWQITSHPDEARYTIAVARMIATGDYILPYAAWGELRLLKPPLTYYYIVAGFALFGQTVFGAKVFWLASAGLILWLTWALARAVGATRTGAAVAVAALAGNLLFFRAALTHNPDIPMVLGLTLALLGAVKLLEDRPAPVWAAYALWLGLAWAFLAKGLLAAVLAGLVVGARLLAGARGMPSRHEIAAIALALVGGLWWHAVVALREPQVLMVQFFGDQVTGKTGFDPIQALGGLGYNSFFMVVGFLPVLLAAIPFPLRRIGRPGPAVAFLLVWIAVIVVIFAFSTYLYERYMLPALPAAAALIGLAFGRLDPGEIARRASRAVRLLLPIPVLFGVLTVAILYGGATIAATLAYAAALAALVRVIWRLTTRPRLAPALILLAALLPGMVVSLWPAYQVLGAPSTADLAVREIRAEGLTAADVAIVRRWHLMERLGLQEGPIDDYLYVPTADPALLEGKSLVIAVFPEDAEALAALGYDVTELRGALGGGDVRDFVSAIARRDLDGLKAEFGETLYLARPGG